MTGARAVEAVVRGEGHPAYMDVEARGPPVIRETCRCPRTLEHPIRLGRPRDERGRVWCPSRCSSSSRTQPCDGNARVGGRAGGDERRGDGRGPDGGGAGADPGGHRDAGRAGRRRRGADKPTPGDHRRGPGRDDDAHAGRHRLPSVSATPPTSSPARPLAGGIGGDTPAALLLVTGEGDADAAPRSGVLAEAARTVDGPSQVWPDERG